MINTPTLSGKPGQPHPSRGSDPPLRGVAELVTAHASRLAELPQLADGLPNRITIAGVLVGLTQAAALPAT
jgi:hypothetical protein